MTAKQPKVIFKQIPIELETEMFFGFLDKDWSFKITDKYPQFVGIKEINSEEERKLAIKNEIVKIRTELGDKINSGLKFVEEEWNKIQREAFKVLSEIIQEDWPKKEILGYVSINPICPRFLDLWSFSVPVDRKHPNLVIAHEISHFLYFKKLKKDFPKITRDKYESPHKEWVLSEIITPIILNDPRILKLIGPGAGFYEKHKILEVNGKLLIELIQNLYNKQVIEKKDFTEFIRKSLGLIKDLK